MKQEAVDLPVFAGSSAKDGKEKDRLSSETADEFEASCVQAQHHASQLALSPAKTLALTDSIHESQRTTKLGPACTEASFRC